MYESAERINMSQEYIEISGGQLPKPSQLPARSWEFPVSASNMR
jgi:hypothetical protein